MTNKPDKLDMQNEQELDALLLNLDIPAPDAEITREVSPWRHSMKLLLWGMGLCSIRLNLWYLNYILPALGAVLMVVALTSLRRESRWFRLAWWGTLGHLVHTGIMLFLQGTIWHSQVMGSAAGTLLQWSYSLLYLVVYFAPLLGVAQLRHKAGLPAFGKWLLGLMLVSMAAYIWMVAASAFPVSLPLLAFVIYFGLLIWLLRRAFRDMEQVGYMIHSRPAPLSDLPLGELLAGFLLLCTVLGMTVGQRYPMEWESVNLEQEHRGQETLMAELAALGMPKHILMDLTAEDVASLAGATVIRAEERHFPNAANGASLYVTHGHIGLSNADGTYRWKLLVHFRWEGDPGLRKTAHIISSALENLNPSVAPTGRILYDKDDITYTEAYHKLELPMPDLTAWPDDLVIHPVPIRCVAAFSPPAKGLAHRGYILYQDNCDRYFEWAYAHAQLTYRNNKLQYPGMTAEESTHHLFSDFPGFTEFQTDLQLR